MYLGVSGRILVHLGTSGGIWGIKARLSVSEYIWAHLGASKRFCAYFGISGCIWAYLGASWGIWRYLGVSGRIWVHLGAKRRIWAYLGVSGRMWLAFGVLFIVLLVFAPS